MINEQISTVLQRALVKANQKLRKLQICGSDMTYIYVELFLNGLEHNRTIEHLGLSGCSFDQSAVVGLANALQMCHGIKSLDLSSCGFSDKNMATLLRALRGHPTLQHLDIRNNECSHGTFVELSEFLESTNVLQTLDVTIPHDAEIPSLGVTKKRRSVSKHRKLRVLYTRRNPLNDNGVEFSCSVSCQLKV